MIAPLVCAFSKFISVAQSISNYFGYELDHARIGCSLHWSCYHSQRSSLSSFPRSLIRERRRQSFQSLGLNCPHYRRSGCRRRLSLKVHLPQPPDSHFQRQAQSLMDLLPAIEAHFTNLAYSDCLLRHWYRLNLPHFYYSSHLLGYPRTDSFAHQV